jgi:hypothetical protein
MPLDQGAEERAVPPDVAALRLVLGHQIQAAAPADVAGRGRRILGGRAAVVVTDVGEDPVGADQERAAVMTLQLVEGLDDAPRIVRRPGDDLPVVVARRAPRVDAEGEGGGAVPCHGSRPIRR